MSLAASFPDFLDAFDQRTLILSDVATLVRDGVPPDQIGEFYPGVTAEAARDAADFSEYVDSYGSSEPRQVVA